MGVIFQFAMTERYLPTIDQIRQAKLDLAEMKERAEEISRFTSAGYGESDRRTVRAQELVAALQRLIWEIERDGVTPDL
jgi:hypothetical protein